MAILGSIMAIGFALAFAAVGILVLWGGFLALRQEIGRSFVYAPTSGSGRLLTILGLLVPMLGAATLSLLAAGWIVMIALGLG